MKAKVQDTLALVGYIAAPMAATIITIAYVYAMVKPILNW